MHRIARSSALNFLKNGHDAFNPAHQVNAGNKGFEGHPQALNALEIKSDPSSSAGHPDPEEVLRLVFMKGLTIVKAAKRLNISIETAKFQLISAVRQFKGKVST